MMAPLLKLKSSTDPFLLGCGIVGGLLLLLTRFLALLAIPPNFDEMVQFYMTLDISRLLNFPVYFYGQQYMGPLESYLLAPLFRLTSPDLIPARLFNGIFYLSFLGLFWRTVRKLFDTELSTYLFLILSVLPFPALFWTSVIGHVEMLPLAVILLILLLKISEGGQQVTQNAFWLGLGSGLAFWCNGIFVVWLVPIGLLWTGVFGIVPSGRRISGLIWFSIGFLAGLSPVWIHGLRTGTLIFIQAAGVGFSDWEDFPHNFYLFLSRGKQFLSFSIPEEGGGAWRAFLSALSYLPFAFLCVGFSAWAVSFFRGWRDLSPQKKTFCLFVFCPPWILAALYTSRNLCGDEGIRYFLPSIVSYPFVFAWTLRQLRSRAVKAGVLSVIVSISLLGSVISLREEHGKTLKLKSLVHFLLQNNLRYGIADPGIAYALNAFGQREIIATPLWHSARYGPVWASVKKNGPQFFILRRSEHPFRQEVESDENLRKAVLGDYDVFYGSSPLLSQILNSGDAHKLQGGEGER